MNYSYSLAVNPSLPRWSRYTALRAPAVATSNFGRFSAVARKKPVYKNYYTMRDRRPVSATGRALKPVTLKTDIK